MPTWLVDALACAALVAVAVLLSLTRKWNIEKDLGVGAVRTVVQLIAVGYALEFVFGQDRVWLTLLILLVMVLVGAHTALVRRRGNRVSTYILNVHAIGTGTTFTVGLLWATGVVDASPQYLIPLAGMSIGVSTTAISLAVDRFGSEIWSRRTEIEAKLSLGADSTRAARGNTAAAARAGMTSSLNLMRVVGIVQLPGAMVGMILAGASPMEAVRLQIIVVFMLTGTTSIANSIVLYHAMRRVFSRDHQLRLSLLPRE
jgi:putative ABC transport system permease protein